MVARNVAGTAGVIYDYERLGVMFVIDRNGFVAVASICPPKPARSAQLNSGAVSRVVVPGVGAYGVLLHKPPASFASLGASRRELAALPPSKTPTEGIYTFSNKRVIHIDLDSQGLVSVVTVLGPFRTAEGVTEHSGVRDLLRAYGKPDFTLNIGAPETPPPLSRGFLTIVLQLFAGCLAGLALRWRHTAKSRVLYAAVAGAFVSGGSGVIVARFVSGLPFQWPGHPLSRLAFIVICMFMASGCAASMVYEALRRRLSSGPLWLVLVAAVLAADVLVGMVSFLMWPGAQITIAFAGISVSLAAFLPGLFLCGPRSARHPPEN